MNIQIINLYMFKTPLLQIIPNYLINIKQPIPPWKRPTTSLTSIKHNITYDKSNERNVK